MPLRGCMPICLQEQCWCCWQPNPAVGQPQMCRTSSVNTASLHCCCCCGVACLLLMFSVPQVERAAARCGGAAAGLGVTPAAA